MIMDWKEELRNNIRNTEEIIDYIDLSPNQTKQLDKLLLRYPMSIPRYYLSLIDRKDKNDPIKKMCIPTINEFTHDGSFDTSGESLNTVITGLQHKYDETALILSTNQCAMYCRHCFRKRLVGVPEDETIEDFNEIINYIKEHEEISNVLISGGDSLLNSNKKIENLLDGFSQIDHLDYIRLGTRVPVVFPDRIIKDKELLQILKRYNSKKQIYIVTQFNHPNEITDKSSESVKCFLNLGIPVRNQTVLLKGINDSSRVLGKLLKDLTSIGVIPYYVFQCRPVKGVKNHFQVPLKKGIAIVEKAKNMQNGQGKSFRYCMSHISGKIEILGLIDDNTILFKHHQAKNKTDKGKIFTKFINDHQSWLDDINI